MNHTLPENFPSLLHSLKGDITVAEGALLYRYAANATDGCIVEVGSYRGKAAVAMALGVRNQPASSRPTIYCVEPHRNFTGFYGGEFSPEDRGAFYEVMCRTEAYKEVALINLSSEQVAPVWQDPIGFIFIDGDHRYLGVKRDFECWEPHLLTGGLIAFDDASDPQCGPYQLIREIIESGNFIHVESVGKIVVLKKIVSVPNCQLENLKPRRRRILIACHNLVLAGGLLRFERVGTILRRWGHEVAFLTFAAHQNNSIHTALPVFSLEQAAKMQWDAVMVPGAGFPDGTIRRFSTLRKDCFGIRVQHILNDQSHRDNFLAVNGSFKPHIVIFNNAHWPVGSFTDFKADRFHVLPGAVDIKTFKPIDPHPVTTDTWIIGGQARKNPKPLIEALAYLPSHIKLRLFGEDVHQLAFHYQTLLENGRLELIGALHGDEALSAFYRSVNCIVMTETVAGWANLVAEAMASGIPVICTGHGTTYFAVHEKTALIIDIPSPENISASISRLMAAPLLCQQLTENARRTIESFSWEDYAEQLLRLIQHDGASHYTYAPELDLYGKWPVSERLEGLAPLLEKADNMSIIDLGAAEGVLSLEFLKRGASKVHGFELNRHRIRKARALCAKWNTAEFHVADLSDWKQFVDDFSDVIETNYDIVLYLGIHHHLPATQRQQTLLHVIDMAEKYFAIRTTPAMYETYGIDNLLVSKGFELLNNSSASEAEAHLGTLRIYARR